MINAEQVRQRIRSTAVPDQYEWTPTRGQKGALVGYFNKQFGKEMRYLMWSWLFRDDLSPLHYKDMTDQEWFALLNWVEFGKIEDQVTVGELFDQEAIPVLNAALKAFVEADWSVQYQYDLDPADFTPTAVSLGGEIVSIEEGEVGGEGEARERQAPPLMANTRFSELHSPRKDRQSQILRELGYDDPSDPVINF